MILYTSYELYEAIIDFCVQKLRFCFEDSALSSLEEPLT